MVAMLFSTVSGVLVRSCDPSLGAIFVAPIPTTSQPDLTMKESCFEFWWMKACCIKRCWVFLRRFRVRVL